MLRAGLPNHNFVWEGEVGYSMLRPVGRLHRGMFKSQNFEHKEKFNESFLTFLYIQKSLTRII